MRAGAQPEALARSSPLAGTGDDQLVLLLRDREAAGEQALGVLYERYAGAVFGLARRLLADDGLAEEVLQETFWRLWQHAGTYRPGQVRFATWLLRIAHNLSISERRRLGRRPQISTPHPGDDEGLPGVPDVADTSPDVPDQVWLAQQRRAVLDGLKGLPPAQREAVELAFYGGLSHAEIAAFQAAPLSTVKTRLSLGLRKLAEALRPRQSELVDTEETARG